jgi:hypothetical protein
MTVWLNPRREAFAQAMARGLGRGEGLGFPSPLAGKGVGEADG